MSDAAPVQAIEAPGNSPAIEHAGGEAGGPLWFGPPARPLFGWVHPPGGPGASVLAGAVVLCPALYGEQSASHPAYRTLARDLAACGHWVVRFDYEGTGDSSGPTTGTGRVAAWLEGIDRAVALARRHTGGPVALVGMRMGALLAALAADRRGDVDALVLWDPCDAGRGFLRRHEAIQAMEFPATAGGSWTELPGYALDEAEAAEVGALRLPSTLRADRALVVSRPGTAHPAARLAGGPQGSTGEPTLRQTLPGEQEALLEVDHLLRRPPAATSQAVVSWLDETLRSLAGASPPAGPGPAIGTGSATGAPLPVGGGPVDAALPVDGVDGVTVVERVRWFGGSRLFGIETLPAGRSGAAGEADDLPTVVLLSSGSESHVGPSRLWVRLARRWAAGGRVRCVRVDLSGWGESPAHPGRPAQVLRPVEAFDDVRDVLAGVGDPRRAVLVGLCSGGYQALESALEVPPAAVLVVNPVLRFTPPELAEHGTVSPRRQLCDPRRPWVGSVRGRLPRPAAGLVTRVRSAASRFRFARRVEGRLVELVDRGVAVYCVCGDADAGPLLQVRRRTRTAWASSGRVRVDVVPGLDHALLPKSQRDEVCGRLTRELERLAGAPRLRPTGPSGAMVAVVGS